MPLCLCVEVRCYYNHNILCTLRDVGFDGIMTSAVFAWEDRAVESSRLMRERIQEYVERYWGAA